MFIWQVVLLQVVLLVYSILGWSVDSDCFVIQFVVQLVGFICWLGLRYDSRSDVRLFVCSVCWIVNLFLI